MELRHYIQMIIRGWWWIALTTLVAVAVSLVLSLTSKPTYQAKTTFIVLPSTSVSQGGDVYYSLDVLDKRSIISTYADVLTSDRLFLETIKTLGLENSIQVSASDQGKPKYTHTTTVLPDSNILELMVEGPNPELTASIANNLGQYGIEYIKSIYSGYDINILDFAPLPQEPVSPRPLRDAGIAGALGLIIGALLAISSEEMRVPLNALRDRRNTDRTSSALTRRFFTNTLEKQLQTNPELPTTLALISCTGVEDLMADLPEAIIVKMMQKITRDLRSQLRGNDIVCRWDTTIFGLMLPNTSEDAATRTVERIRQSLIPPFTIESTRDLIHLEPTAGITTSKNGDAVLGLIHQAEIALETTRFSDNPTSYYSIELDKQVVQQDVVISNN
jgi:capsular polysaccharide biosynthesis protein